MNANRDADRIIRAWLDLMPTEAPERAVADVLDQVAVVPQRRSWRWPIRRPFTMTRFFLAASAAVIVAVVGGALLLARPSADTGHPPPSPSSSPEAATDGPIPAGLAHIWLGDARDVPGMGLARKPEIILSGDAFLFNDGQGGSFASRSSGAGANEFRLVITDPGECPAGSLGRYPFALSPGGQILTISPGDEDCDARQAAVVGTWYRYDACGGDADGCFGELEAGTWKSQTLDVRMSSDEIATWQATFGALTYTVPDGWANPIDNRGRFNLVPASEYPLPEDQRKLFVWMFPRVEAAAQDADCPYAALTRPIPQTADAFTSWIAAQPSVVAGPIHDVTIDGHQGRWLDVSMASDWTRPCSFSNGTPYAPLLFGERGNFGLIGVGAGETDRFFFVDIGGGRMVELQFASLDPTRTDAFFAEAMPIIESFHFN